jgi:COP9 signalosome complex subunit 6
MRDAVWMLQQRVKIIKTYLAAVNRGEHPRDLNLLRAIKSLCNKLPAMDSEKFNEAFQTSYQDSLLISYLGMLTKGCNAMNEVAEKFQVINERSRRRPFFM